MDVTVAGGIEMGPGATILLTPQDGTGDARYHATRLSTTEFRIVLDRAATRAIRFGYAVFN